ncbi:MAG TPA: hypothetical protein VJY34_03215, partial [Roseiarcus sp.]|nr:hypothetical protein [Roseiarcus sp.]
MTTKTWDGTTNDWYNNNGADWSPTGDPAATDDVIVNGGEAQLNPGDAGFTVASITLSNSGVLAIADPGVTQSVTGNVTNTAGSLDLQYGGALSVSGNLTNSGALGLDDGTPGSGSSLTVGGNLTNTGTLNLDTFS